MCGKGFRQKHNLTIHMSTHSTERPHVCTICGKSFKLKGSLTTHLKIHTGERSHICSICEKSFRQSGHLTKHLKIHTDKHDSVSLTQSDDLQKHRKHPEQFKVESDLESERKTENVSNDQTDSLCGLIMPVLIKTEEQDSTTERHEVEYSTNPVSNISFVFNLNQRKTQSYLLIFLMMHVI